MRFMQKSLNTRFLALLFAAFVVAGCSSTSNETPQTPTEPPGEPTQPEPPVAPPQETVDADFPNSPSVPEGPNGPLALTYYFEYDKAVISQADLRSLQLHAGVLRRNQDRTIVIEGHCDERGTREYNLALGERRANAIRSFLTSAGVSARQIETVSYGEEQPENPGHTDMAWSKNRRGVLNYR
jgi:peptidoglycan-associated lipoprotein